MTIYQKRCIIGVIKLLINIQRSKIIWNGVIRKIDELGRVTIPIEIRERYNINVETPLEIFINGKEILLKKVENSCCICGASVELVEYKNKQVCKKCIKELEQTN